MKREWKTENGSRESMGTPVVSVIIPVYNNERYAERCVRSVLEQTYPHLEILLIDDGSTDGSGQILQRLAKKDPRIILTRQENAGVSAARNAGIAAASGEYLTFVDGDDYLEKTYIEKMLCHALERDLEMVLCGFCRVSESGKALETVTPGRYERFTHEEWLFRISAVWCHLYKRTLWERYGMRFAEGVRGEDMPVALFFAAMCPAVGAIDAAGYYYVQHEDSAMGQFRGLRSFDLPYQELERVICAVREYGVVNSPEFFELFVLRILATCYFQLSPGASGEKMNELSAYILRILKQYFPNCGRNPKTSLRSGLDIPFAQKAAVKCLIFLVKTGWIRPVGNLMSRRKTR